MGTWGHGDWGLGDKGLETYIRGHGKGLGTGGRRA